MQNRAPEQPPQNSGSSRSTGADTDGFYGLFSSPRQQNHAAQIFDVGVQTAAQTA
jgi:hypothetical protein